MTIKECAEAVATQSVHVDTLGMLNVAQLSPADQISRKADYEIEKAKLQLLREQLLTLMRAPMCAHCKLRPRVSPHDFCESCLSQMSGRPLVEWDEQASMAANLAAGHRKIGD